MLQQFICIKGLPEGEYLGLDVRYKMKQIRAVKRLSLIYRSESSGLSVTSCTGTTEVCRIWIAQGARVHACVCVCLNDEVQSPKLPANGPIDLLAAPRVLCFRLTREFSICHLLRQPTDVRPKTRSVITSMGTCAGEEWK